MAIVKFGVTVVGIRGTVDGLKFSANKSGPYVTGWARSANPRTEFQTAQRSTLGQIPQLWRTLTPGEQLAWDVWAALPAQDRINSLGEIITVSGFNWFTIINTRLLNMDRAFRKPVPTQTRPTSPTILTMQLPFIDRQGAWVTYAAGQFAPDFDQVIEISIHPTRGLSHAPKQFKQLLLDQNPADVDAGFVVPYENRINIGGVTYRGFALMYRQTTDGLRSAAGAKIFDSPDTPPFTPAASDYDGVTNFALRGADLTGNADSKVLTYAVWFRIDGSAGTTREFQQDAAGRFVCSINTANKFRLQVKRNDGTTLLDFTTVSTFAVGATWHSVLVGFDLAAASQFLTVVVDGTLETPTIVTGPVDDTVDWTRPNHAIGALVIGGAKFDGCLSQYYFHNAAALDFTDPGNIRLFIDPDGNPEFLGANGTFPTKSQPIIYMTDGDPSSNAGSGGNFVNQAALLACGTTP